MISPETTSEALWVSQRWKHGPYANFWGYGLHVECKNKLCLRTSTLQELVLLNRVWNKIQQRTVSAVQIAWCYNINQNIQVKTGRACRENSRWAYSKENYGLQGRRRIGRPKLRWIDGALDDIKKTGVKNWWTVARHKKAWRKFLGKSTVHIGL
jgi:hypothetical protein